MLMWWLATWNSNYFFRYFQKCFYEPTSRTKSLTPETVKSFYAEHSINVDNKKSEEMVKPILTFEDANLDSECLEACKNFEKPTPIQSMCWPVIASGKLMG